MILIADSGSTKADWRYITRDGRTITEFSTMGFNPYFHTAELVRMKLAESEPVVKIKNEVEYVFFYGAGCSSEPLNAIIKEGLQGVFANASVIVDHDLNASAYATYIGNPVISCILGTGSNSCFFDGSQVYEEVPSLAYILGDEGSGSYFGKRLLRDYFYKRLPQEISEAFWNEFGLTDKELVKKVYNEPDANVYLASFMKFISQFKGHSHVKNWMVAGFREFISIHVKCFKNYSECEVSFIGSVAFHFSEYLEEACELEGVKLGEIIKKPIDNLVRYHLEYKIPLLEKAS